MPHFPSIRTFGTPVTRDRPETLPGPGPSLAGQPSPTPEHAGSPTSSSRSSCPRSSASVGGGRFCNAAGRHCLFGFDYHTDPGAELPRHTSQHAQRVALVVRGFQTANLLLRGLHAPGQLFLRKPGLPTQGRKLQRHLPGLPGLLESVSKLRVGQLLSQVAIEIRLLHGSALLSQLSTGHFPASVS
jgi:hypothetical protein